MHLLAILSLAWLPHTGAPRPPPSDSVLARKLRWAALDQKAVLNYDSALVLLQASRRTDPGYFAAQYDYFVLRHTRYEDAALRDEALSLRRSADPGERCFGLFVGGYLATRSTMPDLLALERDGKATTCTAVFVAIWLPRRASTDSLHRAIYARALRQAPELEDLWSSFSGFLALEGQLSEAARAYDQGLQAVRHPLSRVVLATTEVLNRRARGDTIAALALKASIRAAVQRDGRLGLRAANDGNLCNRFWDDDLHEDAEVKKQRVFGRTRTTGDWAWMARTLFGCGKELSDRGAYVQAIEYLTRALVIADSVLRPDLHLQLYVERGRAYRGLGRLDNAERDLRQANTYGAVAGWQFSVADAHHNLAHVHESAGRWIDANRSIEEFVVLARPMAGVIRLTSLLDAGEIRWKAGWHASARVAFEEMVRVSDELGEERYWAGAYYERIGDLQRAREYYRKSLTEGPTNARASRGLVRVYESLGQADSAEAAARLHDAHEGLWPPLELPLLPPVLARRGHATEALGIARAWALRQERRGNVHGAALAHIEVARLALDARLPNEALLSASRAESLATFLHLARERVQAVTLRGRAIRHTGSLDSAVSTLRRAAHLARTDSAADNLLDAHLALGDALAERGQTDAALEAFDRAARATERVTGSLVEDLDRARYRDRHLLAFDGAIQALVRSAPAAARLDPLIEWSARRKAAALALATRNVVSGLGDTRDRLGVRYVQSRLGVADALVDYVVLDSLVAAIIITREHASLVRLPVARESLSAMVEGLRRPLVAVIGGRLDLARAPYSLAIAGALHEALVRPLASALVGKRRLLIVPDGSLHALSFEALVVTAAGARAPSFDYSGARYLIDEYEIDYLPSTSMLKRRESKHVLLLSAERLLVVSYGAPGAEREAKALEAAWPRGQTTLLEGGVATERATQTAMSRYGVVHFAVHAQASARDPLASHLRLVADSVEDGYLNLSEIAAARIGARLVVLSACETDAGPIYNGEGVMGLARAFLVSGAHSVIGTQWPVGPTMADLMGEFYRQLAAGESPSPALRAAKLALRSKRETAHPFYWAAAVLVAGGSGR
jgi:CHAT domain-containing protein